VHAADRQPVNGQIAIDQRQAAQIQWAKPRRLGEVGEGFAPWVDRAVVDQLQARGVPAGDAERGRGLLLIRAFRLARRPSR
jgi:hypothetical protein